MTTESLVNLSLFIEDAELLDFEKLLKTCLKKYNLEMEYIEARTNFEVWCDKFTLAQLEKFVNFAENF